jgi:predicted permease
MFMDLFYRLRALFQRNAVESEMDGELRFHFEKIIEKYVNAGIPREEAVRRACLAFGGSEQIREECRDARGVSFIETLLHDLRFGARMLRKAPGFSLIAVLTLALGIGASTAVFSVVNAILLKALPYPDPGRIMVPSLVSPPGVSLVSEYFPWHPVQFLMVTRQQTAFQDLGAFENDSFNLTNSGDPVYLEGFRVSAGFFPTLGISPVLGHAFTVEEDRPGHELEVILSHQLWQERFGADTNILGRSLRLNGNEYTVVGVMPAGFMFPRAEAMPSMFNFPREAKLWVPLAIPENFRGPSELAVIGRLKPGLTIEQAQADINLVTKAAETQDPIWKGWFNTRLIPLSQQIVGGTQRPVLLMLGAVGVVLLIACSNVANLSLTRSIGRSKEFTLRTALGAARSRLVKQLLTESLLLATAGGLAGTLLAEAAVHLVKTFGPSNIPRLHEVSLDLWVLLFALTVTCLTGVLFGLAPALSSTRTTSSTCSNKVTAGSAAIPPARELQSTARCAGGACFGAGCFCGAALAQLFLSPPC